MEAGLGWGQEDGAGIDRHYWAVSESSGDQEKEAIDIPEWMMGRHVSGGESGFPVFCLSMGLG